VIDLTVGVGNYTLTTANGGPDEARRMMLKFTGAPSADRVAIIPPLPKLYIAHNAFSNASTVTISTGSGSTVVLPQNRLGVVYCDGTEVFFVAGTALVNLSSGVTGTLPIANGGTGQTTASAAINALLPSQTSNDGKALLTDGTNPLWGTLAPTLPIAAFTNKILYGLGLAIDTTDAANDVVIDAGACVSDDGTTVMTLGSSYIKQTDATFVVGTNQGGRDTGSTANGTWYVWVIHRPDTAVTDVLFSLSSTAPTMPANYTKKKRIGAVFRKSGALSADITFNGKFVSAPQTITSSGALSLPHGLSAPYKNTGVRYLCITADSGYTPGDIFDPSTGYGITNSIVALGVVVVSGASTLEIRYANSNPTNWTLGINFTTGARAAPLNANWRAIFYAEEL